MDIALKEEDEDFVMPRLFSRGLEEILQSIFLYLDPKSLKNSKLTCSEWMEFIDRRVWGSIKAKKVLYRRLISNWRREDPVRTVNIKLNQSERKDGIICKNKVIFLWHNYGRHITTICASTHEVLFSRELRTSFSYVDIGENFLVLADSNRIRIIDKFTGKVECSKAHSMPGDDCCIGVKVIGGQVIVARSSGDIQFYSQGSVLSKLSVKEIKTKHKRIVCIAGDDKTLVIGLENRIMFWDLEKDMENENFVELPEDFCPTLSVNWTHDLLPDSMHLEFFSPFVLVSLNKFDIFEPSSKKIRIFNIATGEMIRHMEMDYHHVHFDGRFLSFSSGKVDVFDIEELTDKEMSNEQLWQTKYENYAENYKGAGLPIGATTKTKMVVVHGTKLKIFDFWGDRDYEGTENTDSDSETSDDDSEDEENYDFCDIENVSEENDTDTDTEENEDDDD